MVFIRAGGTRTASLARKSRGSKTIPAVPSLQGRFRILSERNGGRGPPEVGLEPAGLLLAEFFAKRPVGVVLGLIPRGEEDAVIDLG